MYVVIWGSFQDGFTVMVKDDHSFWDRPSAESFAKSFKNQLNDPSVIVDIVEIDTMKEFLKRRDDMNYEISMQEEDESNFREFINQIPD